MILVDPPTKCQQGYKEAATKRLYSRGGTVPRCRPDGTYDEVQCCPSGYCWCSNSSGSMYGLSKGWPLCATGGEFQFTGLQVLAMFD